MQQKWCAIVVMWIAACGDSGASSQGPGGAAGTAGAGVSGTTAFAGTSASAGKAAGSAGAVSVSGAAGGGGKSPGVSAGASAAGSGGLAGSVGAAGSGGDGRIGAGGTGGSSAGAGGMSATAGAGGSVATRAATPSAGCLKNAARPQGGVVMQSDRIYTFPDAYDGKTPMPFVLALHAAGNPNTQLQTLTNGSKLEHDFVRAFPKSAGSAWVYGTDSEKLKGVIDEVMASYCIDTSRMFATGHSSGAQMVVQMLCNGEKRFAAVAPVAASKYCAKLSPIAVLYIQGMMDQQRGGGNGKDVVDVFTAGNTCGTSSAPKPDVASCTSSFDHMAVTPGCVTYEGCSVPTLWCSHNDNGYNSTDGRQHGWPCFASSAIAEFFLSF